VNGAALRIPEDGTLFIVDDLLAASVKGMASLLRAIVTVRRFATVRTARRRDRRSAPPARDASGERSGVDHR
jgi:hypothetical protein